MPPRRATRAATSTPTRALSASRAPPQGNTPGRTTALESTPLPDVEAEQSFAYGSSNTKLLPQKLVAQKKTSIEQMAKDLEIDIAQAQRNFQAQRDVAGQYGVTPADARAARAARRSSDRQSRESSVESDHTPVPKPSRRAKGLSSNQTEKWLQDIPEESSPPEGAGGQDEADDEAESSFDSDSHHSLSRHTPSPPPPPACAEQSTMPHFNRFDQTYDRERGFHVQGAAQPPADTWDRFLGYTADVRNSSLTLWARTRRYLHNYTFDQFNNHCAKVVVVLSWLAGLFLIGLLILSIGCDWYCETPWSLQPSRAWHHGVNNICRFSSVERWSGGNTTEADTPATRASALKIARLQRTINSQKELVQDLQAKQSVTSAVINEIKERQLELLQHQSDLQSRLADPQAAQVTASAQPSNLPLHSSLSPILKRINYASPSLGAVIVPHLTSPTKTKHFPFYQRLVLGSAGLKKYQSRPPVEALKPWAEHGDCWCAASTKQPNDPADVEMDGNEGRYTQLGVYLSHDIFPDEIVIEHLPLETTPSPNSAPKDIEIWGEFSHLPPLDFSALMMGPHPIKELQWHPPMALLGRFRYDAVANEKEGKYLQTFRLDVNQGNRDEHWVKKLVLRVNSNWGGDNTCLYRVRVHGVPVQAHPGIVVQEN